MRRKKVQLLMVAAWSMAFSTLASGAQACSLEWFAMRLRRSCGLRVEGSLVFAPRPPTWEGEAGEWIEDGKFSAIAERSRRELRPYREDVGMGPELRAYRHFSSGKASVGRAEDIPCSIELEGQAADPPPAFGEFAFQVTYTEGGSDGSGCSCPEVDTLAITPVTVPEETVRPTYAVTAARRGLRRAG